MFQLLCSQKQKQSSKDQRTVEFCAQNNFQKNLMFFQYFYCGSIQAKYKSTVKKRRKISATPITSGLPLFSLHSTERGKKKDSSNRAPKSGHLDTTLNLVRGTFFLCLHVCTGFRENRLPAPKKSPVSAWKLPSLCSADLVRLTSLMLLLSFAIGAASPAAESERERLADADVSSGTNTRTKHTYKHET